MDLLERSFDVHAVLSLALYLPFSLNLVYVCKYGAYQIEDQSLTKRNETKTRQNKWRGGGGIAIYLPCSIHFSFCIDK